MNAFVSLTQCDGFCLTYPVCLSACDCTCLINFSCCQRTAAQHAYHFFWKFAQCLSACVRKVIAPLISPVQSCPLCLLTFCLHLPIVPFNLLIASAHCAHQTSDCVCPLHLYLTLCPVLLSAQISLVTIISHCPCHPHDHICSLMPCQGCECICPSCLSQPSDIL